MFKKFLSFLDLFLLLHLFTFVFILIFVSLQWTQADGCCFALIIDQFVFHFYVIIFNKLLID